MEATIALRFNQLITDIVARLDNKPGRVIAVIPGNQVAWDDCCDGQLTARLVSMTPVLSPDSTMGQCGIRYWEAVGEVTMLRCAASLNDDGSAPAPYVLLAEGKDAIKDTDAILAGIGAQEWIRSPGSWTPQANQGGCRGIVVQFNFILDQPN